MFFGARYGEILANHEYFFRMAGGEFGGSGDDPSGFFAHGEAVPGVAHAVAVERAGGEVAVELGGRNNDDADVFFRVDAGAAQPVAQEDVLGGAGEDDAEDEEAVVAGADYFLAEGMGVTDAALPKRGGQGDGVAVGVQHAGGDAGSGQAAEAEGGGHDHGGDGVGGVEFAVDGEAGGVVIHFKPSGHVEVREGLVRRDVRPSVAEETAAAPAAPKPQPEYTGPVVRMVAAHKSMAVMEALLADARKAKEVAVIQMMRGIRYHGRIAVDAHPALAYFCTSDNPPVSYSAVERAAQEFVTALGLESGKRHAYARPSRGAWDALLGDDKSAKQLYAAVKVLSDSELEQLHLLLTALAFGQESMEALDTTDSLFNQVAVDLGVDMRDRWRPDEDFLYRRRKEHLEAIARESGAASRLGKLKDYTKGKLADALAKHFQRCAEDDATLPAAMREQGRNWLPGAMLFPAVTADAPAVQEVEHIEADEQEDDADPSDIEADEDDLTQAAA